MCKVSRVVAALLMAISFAAVVRGDELTFQTAARTSQAAPGATGRFFSYFLYPTIGDGGHIAFDGFLTGNTLSDEGIWVGLPGALQLAAREGVAAPGAGAGVTFACCFQIPTINASGQVAFRGNLQGSGVTGANAAGIWAGGAGSLSLVARTGTPAAELPDGVTYLALYTDPCLNDSGEVCFAARVAGTGVDTTNDFVIVRGMPGALEVLAREGDEAPGTGGAVFNNFYDQFTLDAQPILNDLGHIVFRAYIGGAGVDGSNYEGIWRYTPGTGLELVARRGSVAPGTGDLWEYFLNPEIGPQGAVTFIGGLVNDDADPFNDRGVWKGEPGAVELVIRAGSLAPGLGLKLIPNGGDSSITPISADDAVTFNVILQDQDSNPAGTGLCSYGQSGSEMVAYTGQTAPGLGGAQYSGFNLYGPRPISSVLFQAYLTGTGVTGSNNESLWIKDWGSEPALVVRKGDLFDVGGGVVKTISSFHVVAHNWSMPSSYNADRELVMVLFFTDGTAAVVVSSVPVPVVSGDLDGDGDVDLLDFATFAVCITSSGVTTPPDQCAAEEFAAADLDGDGDVDLIDFASFATVFGG